MTPAKTAIIGIVVSATMGMATRASAQTFFVAPFVGVASGPAATTGAAVCRIGAGALAWCGAAAWTGPADSMRAGGEARAGFLVAAPVKGGPAVRPYWGLQAGIVKRYDVANYTFLRPSIGVQVKPGARVGYLVEAAGLLNGQHHNGWSAIVGAVLTR